MIISQISKDNYQIKLPSKIINIYDHTEIQNITKRVIKRINKHNKLYGLAILEIYQDINYGTIIEIKNIKKIFSSKDELEIKITIHTDTPFLYKIDYFDITQNNKNNIYYYQNNFYLELNKPINKRKYLDILEKSEILYNDTYKVINEEVIYMKVPSVAIVGRPNVGKSTIFNKLIGKKVSIIEDTPGVTRDRIYGTVTHNNYKFHLIDTGGIDVSEEDFNDEIIIQANIAIEEAEIILFVVDGLEELNQNDYVIRDILMKSGKRVIVVVNKLDNVKREENIYNYYELGFEEVLPVSGEHSLGLSDLLDSITKDFNEIIEEEEPDDRIKFCLIGRPNVGKSSLVNALLNEEKVIVSPIAGTTRDAIDTEFTYNKKKYVAIDTAGIRKSGKIFERIEKYSVLRSMKAIERSDVCLLVINAEEGIIEHDKHIASYALEEGKPIVIVVNKWDTVNDKNDIAAFTKLVRAEFKFLSYAKVTFVSALTKKRIFTIMPEIDKAYENSHREIKTSVLNEVIRDAVMMKAPPSYKGKRLKISFAQQTGTVPPKFTLFVNSNKLIHFSYERYLENKLRENFDFEGTPIKLEYKNKND